MVTHFTVEYLAKCGTFFTNCSTDYRGLVIKNEFFVAIGNSPKMSSCKLNVFCKTSGTVNFWLLEQQEKSRTFTRFTMCSISARLYEHEYGSTVDKIING